jgi:hypothetical protein
MEYIRVKKQTIRIRRYGCQFCSGLAINAGGIVRLKIYLNTHIETQGHIGSEALRKV